MKGWRRVRSPGRAAIWLLAAWASMASCGGEGAVPEALSSGRTLPRSTAGDPGALDDKRYVAVITASEAVDIASKHQGVLVEVGVRPGDRVTEGDILARLDEKPMREDLALARAERRSHQAILAQRGVELAELEGELAVQTKLVDRGVGAQNKLETARFAVDKARKIRDYAQSQLLEYNARIAQLERRLAEAAIAAPFTGTISLRYRDPGALVQAGAAVIRLIRTESLWVKFAVTAQQAAGLKVDEQITAHLESPVASLPATIRHISPELDPAARLIFVEAELSVPEDLQGQLRSGLPAWVSRAPAE